MIRCSVAKFLLMFLSGMIGFYCVLSCINLPLLVLSSSRYRNTTRRVGKPVNLDLQVGTSHLTVPLDGITQGSDQHPTITARPSTVIDWSEGLKTLTNDVPSPCRYNVTHFYKSYSVTQGQCPTSIITVDDLFSKSGEAIRPLQSNSIGRCNRA